MDVANETGAVSNFFLALRRKQGRTAADFGKKERAWTWHLPDQKLQLQKFYRVT